MIFKNKEIGETDLGEGVSRKIIAHGGTIMSVEVSFNKGSVGAIHTHEHEQVCYVLEGKFKVTIDGEENILDRGDSYYAKPNVPHGVLALEEGKLLDVFTPQRDDFIK